mgnify:CR=1 FL=1
MTPWMDALDLSRQPVVPGADHFLAGKLPVLRQLVSRLFIGVEAAARQKLTPSDITTTWSVEPGLNQ